MKYNLVAIEREYGSGGREIARGVAKKLGIKCYGEEILMMAAEKSGIPETQLKKFEEQSNDSVWDSISQLSQMFYADGNIMSNKDRLTKMEAEIINELADKESCVFLGRGSGFLLGERKDTLSVFIYSDFDIRKKRAIKEYNIDPDAAEKTVKNFDKKRANYYASYRDLMWGDKEGYSLMLNSGVLGVDKCVDLIVEAFSE